MKATYQHPALACLMLSRWDDAFGFLHAQSESTLGEDRSQALLDVLGDRAAAQAEIATAVDALYAVGTVEAGAHALAWSLLTCDPKNPATYHGVLPQVQQALEAADLAGADDADVRERLRVWWRAAAGQFVGKTTLSIFAIATAFLRDGHLSGAEPEIMTFDEAVAKWLRSPPEGPMLTVMPAAKATKLNDYHKQFSEILDKALPLVVARGLDEARKRLSYEFPHCSGAIQALFPRPARGRADPDPADRPARAARRLEKPARQEIRRRGRNSAGWRLQT
jgi:ATP-dependent Lon protease